MNLRIKRVMVIVMVFNVTFNRISVITLRSVLLVEETRVPVKTRDQIKQNKLKIPEPYADIRTELEEKLKHVIVSHTQPSWRKYSCAKREM
jgi:hypothetical protein